MTKKFRKRIIIDVEPAFHSDIKVLATKNNLSLRRFVERALQKQMDEDTKYDNPKEVNE